MNEEIIKDDVLQLCLEIQKRQYNSGNIIFEGGQINEGYREFTFPYKYPETPFFLEKEGLLRFFKIKSHIFSKTKKRKAGSFTMTIDPNAATVSGSENAPKYKQFLPGFYSVSFKLNRIKKWLKKELDRRLEPTVDTQPDNLKRTLLAAFPDKATRVKVHKNIVSYLCEHKNKAANFDLVKCFDKQLLEVDYRTSVKKNKQDQLEGKIKVINKYIGRVEYKMTISRKTDTSEIVNKV